jgi:hypothetical protein
MTPATWLLFATLCQPAPVPQDVSPDDPERPLICRSEQDERRFDNLHDCHQAGKAKIAGGAPEGWAWAMRRPTFCRKEHAPAANDAS